MEKTIIISILIFFLCCIYVMPVGAWTSRDTAWQSGYLLVHAVDWGQTREVADHCEKEGMPHEHNIILGECPSIREVNTYFLTTAILHTGISRWLEARPRRVFQIITFALELNIVRRNYNLGLSVHF